MSALLSALVTVVSVLGIWTAVSLVTAPVVVCCIRSQTRANARRAVAERRQEWLLAAPRR